MDEQLDAGLAPRLGGARGPVQPLPAVVELARPDEDPGERRQRGSDHRLGDPAVPGRLRYGLFAVPPGLGKGVAGSGEPQVGEAGHLQVRPADVAGEGSALQQVPFAVAQPQRPCLGDAEIQQRERPQVVAERRLPELVEAAVRAGNPSASSSEAALRLQGQRAP